jgi:hypothetical protein
LQIATQSFRQQARRAHGASQHESEPGEWFIFLSTIHAPPIAADFNALSDRACDQWGTMACACPDQVKGRKYLSPDCLLDWF